MSAHVLSSNPIDDELLVRFLYIIHYHEVCVCLLLLTHMSTQSMFNSSDLDLFSYCCLYSPLCANECVCVHALYYTLHYFIPEFQEWWLGGRFHCARGSDRKATKKTQIWHRHIFTLPAHQWQAEHDYPNTLPVCTEFSTKCGVCSVIPPEAMRRFLTAMSRATCAIKCYPTSSEYESIRVQVIQCYPFMKSPAGSPYVGCDTWRWYSSPPL